MDKLSIHGGSHTIHSFKLKDSKRLRKANAQAAAMEKRDSNLCGPEEKKPFFKLMNQPMTLEDSKAPSSLWELNLDSFPPTDIVFPEQS